jgi:hypothetical protein
MARVKHGITGFFANILQSVQNGAIMSTMKTTGKTLNTGRVLLAAAPYGGTPSFIIFALSDYPPPPRIIR